MPSYSKPPYPCYKLEWWLPWQRGWWLTGNQAAQEVFPPLHHVSTTKFTTNYSNNMLVNVSVFSEKSHRKEGKQNHKMQHSGLRTAVLCNSWGQCIQNWMCVSKPCQHTWKLLTQCTDDLVPHITIHLGVPTRNALNN